MRLTDLHIATYSDWSRSYDLRGENRIYHAEIWDPDEKVLARVSAKSRSEVLKIARRMRRKLWEAKSRAA